MTATLLKTEGEAFYLDRNSLSLDGRAVVNVWNFIFSNVYYVCVVK